MNDRMRKGCCRLLTLLLTLVLVIPAYGQETLDALAAAQGCTAETLLQSDKLTAGDSVSDWVAIAVSRAGTEGDTSAYRKALERYVTRMYREQGGLDRLRATEWQRTALTALALGADPTAFGRDKNGRSVNLLADGVYQFTAAKSLGTQGLNGWIFGLIALDSARFAVPEDAVYTRATILQALVAAQEPEGGFGLTVGNSDVDLTAMTLQALAPYQNSTVTYTGTSGESVTIREVVRRALAWLSDQQTAEGDFISWDAANLESTAQVIIALCSLGVDPATDARFVKNGISAVDGLMRYRLDDGTFRHILTDGSDVMATEQALLAQEAMERLSAARRSLYDFREEMPEDVKMQVTALNEALTDVAAATPEEAARALHAVTGSPVIITLGGDGCLYETGTERGHIPPVETQVADTIGAGDAHVGALMARRALGDDWRTALTIANHYAAAVTAVTGAQLGDGDFAALKERLTREGLL